jgi:serine/threonine-protein kinase
MDTRTDRRLADALSDRYRIERELGGGGMSRVFLATETALDRRVVIKTVPGDMLSGAAAERFRREILTAARLSHPNIVPVLATGDADGVPWFSMPWVEGASLREQLGRGALPFATAVTVLRDVARALADAHANGVVHRDIKPENILLARGAALVTDFGVAKALSSATQGDDGSRALTGTGTAIGTVAYMAPEQIAADPALDHRADLYAWGLVAYETLAGRRVFDGLAGTALIAAQIGTMPEPLGTVAPHVPAALAAIVMQCLAKEPVRRPTRADDVVAVLESLSGASGATVRDAGAPGTVDDARRPPARTPAVARVRRIGAALGALLVLVAVAAWLVVRARNGVTTDERAIAVAPFRVAGAAPALRYLREGLADLMVPQIQSVSGVRAPGVRVVMERWRSAAGSVDDDLDDARALRVASAAGAGQMVIGEVVGSAERLTITARLLRASDAVQVATARVEGPADSLLALSARMTTELLALGDGASRDRLRSVLSSRPDALTRYLGGEREYRRGRYAAAARLFAEAHGADTTFALAALRVSNSNGWLVGSEVPGNWIARAWAHRERLTGADSLLLLAIAGPAYPEVQPARARFRALEELAARANSAELWFQFGDALLHTGSLAMQPDVYARSLTAFQRAEALDSTFAPALEHQSMLFLMRGDTGSAKAAYERQRRLDPDGDYLLYSRIQLSRQVPGAAPVVPLDSLPTFAADYFGLTTELEGSVVDFAFVDSILARDARRDTRDLGMERQVAWNMGRPSRADAMLRGGESPRVLADYVVAGVLWDGSAGAAGRSAQALERWLRDDRGDTATTARVAAWFATGLWALDRGDTAQVERARAALASLRPAPGLPAQRLLRDMHEQLLSANLAVARRRPDTRQRLERLDSLLIDARRVDPRLLMTANSVIAALWEQVGEPQRALDAGRRIEFGGSLNWLSSTRVRREARLLERLGRPREALAKWRDYLALRARAEPSLQGDLATARAAVVRLERGGADR